MALMQDKRTQDSPHPTHPPALPPPIRNRLSRASHSSRPAQSSSSRSEHAASLRLSGATTAEVRERKDADSGRDTHDQPSSGPYKRRRRLTTADFTRPKRASTACGFCRLRKTKCDNVRPTCGFCLQHNARCVYSDEDGGLVLPHETYPGLIEDSSSINEQQRILERLDELKQMLQQTQQRIPAMSLNPGLGTASPEVSTDSRWTATSQVESQASIRTTARQGAEVGEHHLDRTSSYTALFSESILKWPVFRGVLPEEDTKIDSFVFKTNGFKNVDVAGSASSSRGIKEDAFVPLCQQFLKYAHARNPILDGDELLRDARVAAEDGLKWDSASCLVVSCSPLGGSSSLLRLRLLR